MKNRENITFAGNGMALAMPFPAFFYNSIFSGNASFLMIPHILSI